MAGISKVTVIGNLGRDPETRYTPNGTMNVQFSVAATRVFKDQSGQQQERTTWFRATAWGRLAETLDGLSQSGYLSKGKQVYIEGRLEAREFQDQQSQNRTSLDVNVSEFQLLGSRGDGGGAPGQRDQGSGGQQNDAAFNDPSSFDDVPF